MELGRAAGRWNSRPSRFLLFLACSVAGFGFALRGLARLAGLSARGPRFLGAMVGGSCCGNRFSGCVALLSGSLYFLSGGVERGSGSLVLLSSCPTCVQRCPTCVQRRPTDVQSCPTCVRSCPRGVFRTRTDVFWPPLLLRGFAGAVPAGRKPRLYGRLQIRTR